MILIFFQIIFGIGKKHHVIGICHVVEKELIGKLLPSPTSFSSPRWYSRGMPFCWWFCNNNFVTMSKKMLKRTGAITHPCGPQCGQRTPVSFAIGSHRGTCVTVKCSNDLTSFSGMPYPCWRMYHNTILFIES